MAMNNRLNPFSTLTPRNKRRATASLILVSAVLFVGVFYRPLVSFGGLETCTYISDLVSTNPLSSDLASTGDDHLRAIKTCLKATFPNVNAAVTATDEELNVIDGVTASTAELNIIDGVTASTAELNFTDGVTSAIQTQLDAKATLASANTFTSNVQRISSAAPEFRLNESDATANNALWTMFASGEQFGFGLYNDAASVFTPIMAVDRTTTTVDTINLTGTAVQTNGVELTASSGTFTGTLTGYASNPTGTVTYFKVGRRVTLYSSLSITGTSNATGMTMTGLPAAVQPSINVEVPCAVVDNGATSSGSAIIGTGAPSVITFSRLSTAAFDTAAFTSSGVKGLPGGWSITYTLN